MYSQLLRLWIAGRARSAWRVVCARFLIRPIGCLRDDGPRWCWSSGGRAAHESPPRRCGCPMARSTPPLESEVTAARRSRAEFALVVVREVEERRSCGGRWPSGGRHTKNDNKAPPFGHSRTVTQQKRLQKQKGPVASRQRRLVVAAVCSRPPSKANSARPARVRNEQPEQPEHSQTHTTPEE